jgi:hypothetical protein
MAGYTSGRDLSHHNSIRDYGAARGDTDWVQLKITEGTDFVDPSAATHYGGFAGRPRGPYHFAQPVDVRAQIAHFLRTKAAFGSWERQDMLDCEFLGVNAGFLRALVAEHQNQSGAERRYVYIGVSDLKGPCDPTLWWTPDVDLWVPRYRKGGRPVNLDTGQPDDATWGSYLGFWHPAIRVVQYDDATPLAGGPATDISDEKVPDSRPPRIEEGSDMSGIQLYPATDPVKPGRGTKALPGPAADSVPSRTGTQCRVTTGWGNRIDLIVWFLAEGGGYLNKAGGAGDKHIILSDAPGWFPVPDNTVAVHVQWVSTKDIPGDLEIRFVPK